MTETEQLMLRIEAMLELDLLKKGCADFVLSKEDKDRRIAELSKAIWPNASHVRAAHERNPMNHVFNPPPFKRKSTDVGTDRH